MPNARTSVAAPWCWGGTTRKAADRGSSRHDIASDPAPRLTHQSDIGDLAVTGRKVNPEQTLNIA